MRARAKCVVCATFEALLSRQNVIASSDQYAACPLHTLTRTPFWLSAECHLVVADSLTW